MNARVVDNDYAEFVEHVELTGISMVECSAMRHKGTESEANKVEIQTAYRLDGTDLAYRLEVLCRPQDSSGDDVADLRVVFIAAFEVGKSLEAKDPRIDRFGQDVAVMATYPYAREAIQGLAQRLELGGLTLGLLRRGEIEASVTSGGGPTDR